MRTSPERLPCGASSLIRREDGGKISLATGRLICESMRMKTIVFYFAAAIFFMLTALMISMPALSGNVSVLNSAGEIPAEAPAEQPAVEQQTEPANTNIVPDNSNGALIETPATNSFSNSATAPTNSAPAANAPANK